MMGISWGGMTALQVAARRHPSLGAIVVASFTDHRYADDMHNMGGGLLSGNLAEAGTMFAHATCPPDPALVSDRWRSLWLEHLDVACKGLIVPWSHRYPHLGEPGPAIGYLQEVVRWWDHWLEDVDNDVMDGPRLRTWMQESMPPSTA